MINIFTWMHFAALTFMALYGTYRFGVMIAWLRRRAGDAERPVPPDHRNLPRVTVQLPLYNESGVAERLINSACGIDWPDDRLEIQVLDDSNDTTREIVDRAASFWIKAGKDIKVVRRRQRTGYKAGALNHGMVPARGEFLAVFDADFCPPSDFLKKSMPYFTDRATGFVQARWGYLNEDSSWFTRLQAIFLTGHFVIEQVFRADNKLFFNFNGTAGIWRKETIIASGGWQSDTVTEDLDLSFRAHLGGWKGVYLHDLVVPSELPPTLDAFRNQQKRWAKGSIQTARKLLKPLWRSNANLAQKIDGSVHMLANIGWLCGLIIFLTLLPTLISRENTDIYQIMKIDVPLFICSTLAIITFFIVAEKAGRGKSLFPTLKLMLFLPVFSLGIAPAIATGVIEGLLTRGGEFIRTPKYGNTILTSDFKKPEIRGNPSWTIINSLLLFYSLFPLLFAFNRGLWTAIPFLAIFSAAALMTLYLDVRHAA